MTEQKPDPTGAKILDGAIRVLGDFGFKRATVELVANYAGVSHMTIYRRWPSKNDLLRTAIIGEFTTLLDTAFDQAGEDGTSFADRTLKAFTDTVWAVQSHPLALRELNTDSSEQLPMLSSTSSAVMEASVPLVAEQLHRLGTATEDTPADLDSVADVFVRLAYSLVIVKRPGQPLNTRGEVAEYARECVGPYLQGLTGQSGLHADNADVVDLDQHRSSRNRSHRPHLQIAAASLFSVLTLGAGMTAILSGNVKLPFITPAGISKSTTTETPTGITPGLTQDDSRRISEPQLPAPPSAPASVPPSLAAEPDAVPTTIPQIDAGQRSAVDVSSIGGNSAGNSRSIPDAPGQVLAPVPRPGPTLGPRPLGPGPQPGPGPGPKPPGPGPQPAPGPGPQPAPGPGPKPPGPGPNPSGPGPQQAGPGPKQPSSGNQSGPGAKQPGSGPKQSGPSN